MLLDFVQVHRVHGGHSNCRGGAGARAVDHELSPADSFWQANSKVIRFQVRNRTLANLSST